jgi:hypothetical protein
MSQDAAISEPARKAPNHPTRPGQSMNFDMIGEAAIVIARKISRGEPRSRWRRRNTARERPSDRPPTETVIGAMESLFVPIPIVSGKERRLSESVRSAESDDGYSLFRRHGNKWRVNHPVTFDPQLVIDKWQ